MEIPRKYINTSFLNVGDPWPTSFLLAVIESRASGWKVDHNREEGLDLAVEAMSTAFCRSPGEGR